jgi:hypothetical protein
MVLGRVPAATSRPSLSPEAEERAAAYIENGAIGERMRANALHIALATVARVDVLVSWNFKHIVNLKRIHAYNSVNLKMGGRERDSRCQTLTGCSLLSRSWRRLGAA